MKKLIAITLVAVVSLMGVSSSTNADTMVSNTGTFTEPVASLNFAFRLLNNNAGNTVIVDSFSHSTNGSVNSSFDFTEAGFADGVNIDGVSGISAQGGWVAQDTAGIGTAQATGSWLRAIDAFGPNSTQTPDIGDRLTANLRVAVDYVGDATNLGNFGYGDSTFNPGQGIPGPINGAYGVTSAGGVDTFSFNGLSINTTNDMYTHGQFVDLSLEVTKTGADSYNYVATLSYTMPTTIPEPATGLLMALTGLCLVGRRRR